MTLVTTGQKPSVFVRFGAFFNKIPERLSSFLGPFFGNNMLKITSGRQLFQKVGMSWLVISLTNQLSQPKWRRKMAIFGTKNDHSGHFWAKMAVFGGLIFIRWSFLGHFRGRKWAKIWMTGFCHHPDFWMAPKMGVFDLLGKFWSHFGGQNLGFWGLGKTCQGGQIWDFWGRPWVDPRPWKGQNLRFWGSGDSGKSGILRSQNRVGSGILAQKWAKNDPFLGQIGATLDKMGGYLSRDRPK